MTHNVLPALQSMLVPIDSLTPDPKNARLHPQRNIAAIQTSLRTLGQHRPAVAQKNADGKLVVRIGNGMVEAARKLGWTQIAAIVVEEPDDQAIRRAVSDNRTAELEEWDDPVLAGILRELSDAESTGFTASEIENLFASNGIVESTLDEVPALPAKATSRPGDLWLLGNHRLLCGDSSLPESMTRLLNGQQIHLVNMDPPYNVKVEPRSNNAIAAGLSSFEGTHHQQLDVKRTPGKSKETTKTLRAKDRPLANDFVSDGEFDRLLDAWFSNASNALIPGGSFYIWGGYANCANYPPALVRANFYFSQAIIWNKLHPVLTRKDFMGAHEWCFYGWKTGGPHRFFGPTNVPDLWDVKKVNPQSMVHLTEKPVELAARAIMYSSQKGENVLDLFGGSGSTLIACESLDRNGFSIELDTLYCDVIIERWQKLTARIATLEDGRSYDEVRAERAEPKADAEVPQS